MSYQELRERIIAFSDKDCGTGATLTEIDRAEAFLGVTFSRSYRLFLQEFGWGRFAYQELYGLGSDVPPHLNLIRNTEVERNKMRPALLRSLVPLMNDGTGNHYCLDMHKMHDSEYPVVFWDHELGEDQDPELVSDAFDSWLMSMLARL